MQDNSFIVRFLLRLDYLFSPILVCQYEGSPRLLSEDLYTVPFPSLRVARQADPGAVDRRADLHRGPPVRIDQPQQNGLRIFSAVHCRGWRHDDLCAAFSLIVDNLEPTAPKHLGHVVFRSRPNDMIENPRQNQEVYHREDNRESLDFHFCAPFAQSLPDYLAHGHRITHCRLLPHRCKSVSSAVLQTVHRGCRG